MTHHGAPDALLAYVPRLVVERVAKASNSSTSRVTESRLAAALWIDISGFTPLTARLAKQGPRGAELMTGVLNRVFAELGDRIAADGGDLIDFAGDAILALWPADSDADLRAAVARAAGCAIAIQSDIGAFDAIDGDVLRFYAGVGAGPVTLMHAGGVDGRWKFVAAGAPLTQVAQAMRHCEIGDVVVSPQAWDALSGATGSVVADGFVRLTSPGEMPPASAAVRDEAFTEVATAALRAYVLDSVLSKVDAGQRDWLAELRTVSVAFVTVPDADPSVGATHDRFMDAVVEMQRAVDALDGSLHQVMVDDTGVVFLIAFGLPGHTHEGDARRAVQLALDARALLSGHGFDTRAGVATGKVFCGSYGSVSRKRYAMVGSVVNLAARLAAAAGQTVLCDGATHEAASARIEFVDAPPLTLKGISQPVQVFVARAPRTASRPSGRAAPIMTGRESERRTLRERMERAAAGGDGALLLIEGEAGLGKSLLLAQALADAPRYGFAPLLGESDAVESNTTYFAWRSVFMQLLGFAQIPDAAGRQARVRDAVRDAGARDDFAPLVNAVLPVAIEETAVTSGMSATDRGDATRALLLDLLAHHAGAHPLLMLDDLHWFDSASLQLLLGVRARMPHALVIVASRTIETDAPAARPIFEVNGLVRLQLSQMSPADVGELVGHSLGVTAVPPALIEFLVVRAEGHPLFTDELLRLLREMDVVTIVDGNVRFEANDPRLSSLEFPNRIEGLLASRIDRLEPSRQLALKVASVVGRTFEHRMVREIHPIESDRLKLRDYLVDLTQASLVDEEAPDPRLTFIFRHVLIREAAYGMVAFAQRRELHRKAAQVIEALPAEDREGLNPLLAHHYTLGEDFSRAVDYLELAGAEALRRGAGKEALHFFGEALTLADAHAPALGQAAAPIRRAEFKRQMGEAAFQMLDLVASRAHLDGALERLGVAPDDPNAKKGGTLARHGLIQLAHIVIPDWLRPKPTEETRARMKMAAAIYGTIAEQDYYTNRTTDFLYHSLKAVNSAEAARDTRLAERPYATLAHIMGTFRIEPLVRRYRARALTTTLGRNLAFLDLELAGRSVGHAKWDLALESGRGCVEKSKLYADRQGESLGWAAVAGALTYTGRFVEANDAADAIERIGRTDYAMALRATVATWHGESRANIERFCARPSVEAAVSNTHVVYQAMNAAVLGDWTTAIARADAGLGRVEALGVPIPFALAYVIALPGIYVDAVRQVKFSSPAERESLIVRARRAARVLSRFAFVHPIGRPARFRNNAMIASVQGHGARALRLAREGRMLAEQLGMWPEVAVAEIELAQLGGGAHHLDNAEQIASARGFEKVAALAQLRRRGEPSGS